MQAVVAVQGGTAFQGRALIPKLALSRGIAMCGIPGRHSSMEHWYPMRLTTSKCVDGRPSLPTRS